MDAAQNTVEDLMLRIRHSESVDSSKGVCLYTVDGMPLTDDPFFNTCKSKMNNEVTQCEYSHFRTVLLFKYIVLI